MDEYRAWKHGGAPSRTIGTETADVERRTNSPMSATSAAAAGAWVSDIDQRGGQEAQPNPVESLNPPQVDVESSGIAGMLRGRVPASRIAPSSIGETADTDHELTLNPLSSQPSEVIHAETRRWPGVRHGKRLQWKAGDVVDIETEDGMEYDVFVMGPSTDDPDGGDDALEMRVQVGHHSLAAIISSASFTTTVSVTTN